MLSCYNTGMAKPPIRKKKITDAVLDKELSQLESTSIKDEAENNLDYKQIKILKRIAYYIGKVGLELDEACMLIGIEPKKFREEMEAFPVIKKVIVVKELEYKKDLMATLSARARSGDDKIAQWLLEMKDPDKFAKNKGGGDKGADIMATAIAFIQESSSGGLIKKTSGRALIIQSPGSASAHVSEDERTPKMSTPELLAKINQVAKETP